MNTTVRFLLTAIALLSMVNHASADSAREDVEALRAEVVLKASEIDSSTVEVGAFAVVVYGQGKRYPVSGTWAKLDTARGYVKAIDRQRLILALKPDGWPNWTQRIALERIQTLILAESPSPSSVNRDSTQVTSSRAEGGLTEPSDRLSVRTARVDDNKTSERIAKKLGAGVLMGSLSGFVSGPMAVGIFGGGPEGLSGPAVLYSFGLLGYMVGTAVGVSRVDPHDLFAASLMGSLLGSLSGIGLAAITKNSNVLLVCPIASVASAVWMSEDSRNRLAERASTFPETRHFSVGLIPAPKRGLSAIATLRF